LSSNVDSSAERPKNRAVPGLSSGSTIGGDYTASLVGDQLAWNRRAPAPQVDVERRHEERAAWTRGRPGDAEDTDRGARIGGAAGLILAGIVSVGAFAVVGPLAALLVGVSGGIGGSLVGALIGSGMPETHAHAVSARLQGRGILIAVSVPEAQEKLVRKILTETGGNFVDSD
jgi:hypothetical protein